MLLEAYLRCIYISYSLPFFYADAFQIFDTDKDGFITKLELQKILQAAFAAVVGKSKKVSHKLYENL